jgi:mannose-6-phosphate isomerase-like protein (cupin superfamily)
MPRGRTRIEKAGGVYVNFLTQEEQDRIQFAYQGNYDRLRKIKKVYDPANLFRLNQNIRPARRIRGLRRMGHRRTTGGSRMRRLEVATQEAAELKRFDEPEEVRHFPGGRLEVVHIGGASVGRAVFQPGWKWSNSVRPLDGTHSCEVPHCWYHVSGWITVRMDDGEEIECGPGDVSLLPPGHDAWVVGDEPAVVVDFQGMIELAKNGSRGRRDG